MPRQRKKKKKMGRTSRVRDRGGGVRRRIRCGGSLTGASKQRVFGESIRRRTRRRRGMGRMVSREEGTEAVQDVLSATGTEGAPSAPATHGKSLEAMLRGGAFFGLRRRREGKTGEREKRKRRTSGDYRRRLSRGRLGAVVLLELGDRRERYLGRERRALSTYVLVGYGRGSAYATEAGRKYFRVGARGSCRLVRGMARVYGETGRIKLEERGRYRGEQEWEGAYRTASRRPSKAEVGRRRMRWVMRFKRGARPVHRWVADIYEGAPTMAGRYLRIVPKRSRRMVRVRRLECAPWIEKGMEGGAMSSEGSLPSPVVRRMVVCGRGSVRMGGRGRRVQRRWKRYMAYSGIGNVGNMRRGGRRRTEEGRKGRRRTLRTYMRMVRRRWGGRLLLTVVRSTHQGLPHPTSAPTLRERKYVTERRGRGKENGARARTRTGGRISRVGRPPRLGFGAKRSVLRARVEKGRVAEEVRYRERGGLGLLRGMVAAYGYLRRVKRIRMEESLDPIAGGLSQWKGGRRKRKVQKEGARRRGRGTRIRIVGWRNGEGMERRRERRGREVRKRVS
jgi:NADH:ubiquinone oxidoreductase subunit 2 (subunit N)